MAEQQTTAKRIADMIIDSIDRSTIDFDTGYNPDPLAQTIAAELDAKDKRIEELEAQLAEARARIDNLTALLAAGNANLRNAEIRIQGLIAAQPVPMPPVDAHAYAEAMKTVAFILAKNGMVTR